MAVFKAGFVALVGRPNVGKSTLMNALLGQPVAAVSPKPQTTRRNQLGIYTDSKVQIIFVDTPGLHKELNKLGALMNEQVIDALKDSDVILFLTDASQPVDGEDQRLADVITHSTNTPVILALNKIDLASSETWKKTHQALAPQAKVLEISAAQGIGLADLLEAITDLLPESEALHPADQVTDLYERQIAADLIRAAALQQLREEVPHGIDVRIDQYIERGEKGARIEATIFVERESHKGIVIGAGGAAIKAIGQTARRQIEAMSGRKVFLEVRVKVRKDWRNDEKSLKQFGYLRSKNQ